MYILSCFLLTAILYAILVLLDAKRKQRKQLAYASESELETLALLLSREEFYKTLNFMLMYGIIDFNEYNNIELKSLPYLKG